MIEQFTRVYNQESKKLFKSKKLLFYTTIMPLLSFLLFMIIFKGGVLQSLPVALIDNDQSHHSKEFIRLAKASQYIDINRYPDSIEDAKIMLQKGDVYGIIEIPKGFSKNILAHKGADIVGWYNNQFMTQGGIFNKAFTSVTNEYAKSYERIFYRSSAIPELSAHSMVTPIILVEHILNNNYSNYYYFLLPGILPAMLSLFALFTLIYAFGLDLKSENNDNIIKDINGHPIIYTIAKSLPYQLIYMVIASIMLFFMHIVIGVPLKGNTVFLVVSTLIFAATSGSLGILLISIFQNMRLTLSLSSFYAAPAFAFSGITYPIYAMPSIIQMWSKLLPLSHYHQIFIDIAMRGAPVYNAINQLLILILFLIVSYISASMIINIRAHKNG